MSDEDDEARYIADNYGQCSRGSDCYNGKDSKGRDNGCLKTGWRGVACPYWCPVNEKTIEQLRRHRELQVQGYTPDSSSVPGTSQIDSLHTKLP